MFLCFKIWRFVFFFQILSATFRLFSRLFCYDRRSWLSKIVGLPCFVWNVRWNVQAEWGQHSQHTGSISNSESQCWLQEQCGLSNPRYSRTFRAIWAISGMQCNHGHRFVKPSDITRFDCALQKSSTEDVYISFNKHAQYLLIGKSGCIIWMIAEIFHKPGRNLQYNWLMDGEDRQFHRWDLKVST